MTESRLPIYNLSARHPGLTDAVASYYSEAARVCLDRHHQSPTGFQIDNSGTGVPTSVDWEATDERTKNAHANEIDATEAGAYACILAAVELVMRMVAIHRAETATGRTTTSLQAVQRQRTLRRLFASRSQASTRGRLQWSRNG